MKVTAHIKNGTLILSTHPHLQHTYHNTSYQRGDWSLHPIHRPFTYTQLLQSKGVITETTSAGMLTVAAAAMGMATASVSGANMAGLAAAFLAFEVCVGMYFPLVGTLRSKYIPDSHRSVIRGH